MKDHVESSHLTKFDAFGVNGDQVIDLETWFVQKVGESQDFSDVTKLIKILRVYMVLGTLNIRDVCIDFEPCFKGYTLASVHPKIIKLGQMTTLNMIFHVVV